ncbi:MAG: hypothetical protein OER90_00980 [Gemmatimonadota bacterium]|nr:hypothetical protein [Gemmatimonadota bacterium]
MKLFAIPQPGVLGVISILLGMSVPACTYGPPELQITIANHVARRTDQQFAFAVRFTWVRRPTGLSTFPDGGRWRTLNEAGAVYICDTLSLDVKRLWHADRPAEIRSAFEPWMGPWTEDGVYFSLRGYRRPGPDRSTLVRHDYLIDSAGRANAVADEPPRKPATSQPQTCASRVLELAREEHLSVIGAPET